MKIKGVGKKKEFVIDPDDKDLISNADKEINNLDSSKRELIESILDFKLSNSATSNGSDPLIKSSIGSSLKAILSPQSAAFLLTMIQNYRNINIVLDKLDKEKLITKKTNEFALKLSVKYGSILEDLLRSSEDPFHWAGISISPLVNSKDNIEIYVQLNRMDRKVQHFVIDLPESLLMARLFLEKSVEIIELIDKELAMSFFQKDLEKLDELSTKIKDLRKSVELETEQTEQSRESLVELTPKGKN